MGFGTPLPHICPKRGVVTRNIHELLGHFCIKITERYLLVARTQLIHLPNPTDDLWLKGGTEF